jgi:hypothetical protein
MVHVRLDPRRNQPTVGTGQDFRLHHKLGEGP